MKIFYNGRIITEGYAKLLENNGQCHVSYGASSCAPDGSNDPWMRMDPGPGNSWLEKQPPEKFLVHVFGHTGTWQEMARKFDESDDEYGMMVIAMQLQSLNYWINQVLTERRERAALTSQS